MYPCLCCPLENRIRGVSRSWEETTREGGLQCKHMLVDIFLDTEYSWCSEYSKNVEIKLETKIGKMRKIQSEIVSSRITKPLWTRMFVWKLVVMCDNDLFLHFSIPIVPIIPPSSAWWALISDWDCHLCVMYHLIIISPLFVGLWCQSW